MGFNSGFKGLNFTRLYFSFIGKIYSCVLLENVSILLMKCGKYFTFEDKSKSNFFSEAQVGEPNGSNFDDWLTVLHRSITLADLQLDAQNSYLFTYNTFIKILYMFRALPC